jgi:hypothetical protein
MSLINTILLGLGLLFNPNISDFLFNQANSVGNMGLAGVYLGIIRKRNSVYFFGCVTMFIVLFNKTKFILYSIYILFLLSLISYFNTIHKWSYFIK